MDATQVLWLISIALEAGVLVRGLKSAWRAMCPSFLAYLAMDLAGSSALFWISMARPYEYDVPWRVITCLLAVCRVGLVVESYHLLVKDIRWRFPIVMIVSASALGAAIVHVCVSHYYQWPWSSLETIFAGIGMINTALFFVLFSVILTVDWHDDLPHWHARILCAYLFLSAPCYYAASEHVDSIGKALMVVAAVCYSAWLWLACKMPLTRATVDSGKEQVHGM